MAEEDVRPNLIIVVGWQGRLLRLFNPLLRRLGVMVTSRNHPVGDFSHVPVASYYRSLEQLSDMVLLLPYASRFPWGSCLNKLDDDARIRLQRQQIILAFTWEWAFSSTVACACPQIRRWDLTKRNPRLRPGRLPSVAC